MSKGLSRKQIAWRAAQDLPDGIYVNLGIGLPQEISNHVPAGREVIYQSENGILGVGPAAKPGHEDPGLVDAGGQKVTLVTGASLFDSAASFAMMRGGHLDMTFLGAFQVSGTGDIANWDAQEEFRAPIIGGAMDLVFGAKEVRVIMEHNTKSGQPRIVARCTYPLTAAGVVRRVYTNLAVLDVTPQGMLAREIAEGLTFDDLQARTGARLTLANDCRPLAAPAV